MLQQGQVFLSHYADEIAGWPPHARVTTSASLLVNDVRRYDLPVVGRVHISIGSVKGAIHVLRVELLAHRAIDAFEYLILLVAYFAFQREWQFADAGH